MTNLNRPSDLIDFDHKVLELFFLIPHRLWIKFQSLKNVQIKDN